MPFQLGDTTSGNQVLGASNSGGVELGSATPASTLTVQGSPIVSSGSLATGILPSNGMGRVTGSVLLTAQTTTNVSVGSTAAGFGQLTPADVTTIVAFNLASGYMTLVYINSPGNTLNVSYSVY